MTGPSFTSSTAIDAPKTPRATATPGLEVGAKALVERLRLLGRRGAGKLGRFPLDVSASSVNWLDDERRATGVEQAPLEAALLVREDPQPGDLDGKTFGLRVATCDAEQNAEPRPDLPHDLPVDAYTGLSHALTDSPHGSRTISR